MFINVTDIQTAAVKDIQFDSDEAESPLAVKDFRTALSYLRNKYI